MTSPSPAAPLKPGDRVRLPSGREATLHHIHVPGPPDGAPPGTTFPRAWKVAGFPELTYYEDELTLVEAAPPQPPVEGPGLAEAARQLANAVVAWPVGPFAMQTPEGERVWCALGILGRALAAEEARAQKDRALRERWRDRLLLARAELVVASQKEAVRRARGRIHDVVRELIAGISELGSAP